MRSPRPLLLTAALTLAALPLMAEVSLSVNRDTVRLGETLQLTIAVTNNASFGDIDLRPLERQFEILGRSQRSVSSLNNGVLTTEASLVLDLLPLQEGTISIPDPGITISGPRPVIRVLPGQAQPGQRLQKSSPLALELRLPDHKYRTGAPIETTLVVSALGQLQLLDQVHLDAPDWHIQCWKQLMKRFKRHTANGIHDIREWPCLLTPRKSGELQLPQFQIQAVVLSANQNIWSRPGRMRRGARNPKRSLRVLPAPAHWPTGAIWLPAYALHLKASREPAGQQLRQGEPLTLVLTLAATGLQSERLPSLDWPQVPGLKYYAEPAQTREQTKDDRLYSEHIERRVLLPTRSGRIALPGMRIPWWDITADRLRYAELAPEPLEVSPTAETPRATTALPTEPRSDSAWMPVSAALALAWLLTLGWALWQWYSARAVAVADTSHNDHTPGLRQLAAARNHPQRFYNALCHWTESQARCTPQALARERGDPQLVETITELERALYRNDGSPPPDLSALYQRIRTLSAPTATARSDPLPPLYPG